MGISASHQIPLPEVPKIPPEAYICKYSKDEFNQLLNIIRDCHNVSQYYSTYLLMEKVPVQLPEYKNYSDESENYFNKTRKELIPDLGMSYYAFYNYITALPRIYESTESSENDRKKLLSDIFNNAYIVQKTFIEDLWKTCNIQGGMTIEEIQGLSQ
jgi:hypothetical protein